jgi:L-aminopeptidase/D-esterase-like protein
MAGAGLARAIYPAFTPLDGDLVFALSTGEREPPANHGELAILGTAAANVLARAVARGVYEAAPAPSFWRGPPAHRTRFGGRT